MAFNLGFPLVGMNAPSVGTQAPRRSWQERLFDRLVPGSDAGLAGVNGDDKKALVRQGLLQLAAGIQSAPTLGQGLTQGLLAGTQGLNQGVGDLQERRYRQQMLDRSLLGPPDVQEFEAITKAAGLKPGTPEYQQAANIHLGRAPRAVTGAVKFGELTDAYGRERPTRSSPTTGQQEVYHAEVGQWVPLGGEAGFAPGAQAPVPLTSPMNPGQDFASLGQQFGLTPTSTLRTPERNRKVGGVANSFHLTGQAADWVVPAAQKPAFMQAAQARGYQAIDEGDHVHIEPPGSPQAPAFLGVGQTPAQKAGSEEAARQAAQLQALPQRNALEVQAAGQKAAAETAAKATAERQQEAITALPTVLNSTQQTIGLLDQALSHPGRAFSTGRSGMLVDAAPWAFRGEDEADFGVLLDQIKGQAFLQAFQSLKGSGAITEKEGQAATNAIARLQTTQSDTAFEQSLRELRAIAEKAQQSAIQKAQGRAPQLPARPTAPTARTIRYDAKGNRLP